jgi:hypothetical protein
MSSPPVRKLSALSGGQHLTYFQTGCQRVPEQGRVQWKATDREGVQRSFKVFRNRFNSRCFPGPRWSMKEYDLTERYIVTIDAIRE